MQILDLVRQVLVLPLDNVKLLNSLFLSRLQPEELRAVVASLRLGGFHLGSDVACFGLPFSKNLLVVPAPLLGDGGGGVHPLVLHGDLLELGGQPVPRLLVVGDPGLQRLNGLLRLDDPGLQLGPAALELVDATHAFGLIARPPQLDLSVGLGQRLHGVRFPGRLVLDLLPVVVQLGAESLELGEEGGAVLGLGVPEGLGVLQLGDQGALGLARLVHAVLQLLDLAVEVLALNLQPLLGGLGLVQRPSHLIHPVVGINDGSLQQLVLLVHLRLGLDGILQGSARVGQVPLHATLVLLRLHLVAVEAVDVLAKLGHGVVVLHAQGGQGALVGDVELLELRLEASELSLSLLVQLHLGRGVGAGLLKPGGNVLDVLLQHGAVLLSLGTVASLDGQLLVELLQAGLQLLHLLGVLRSKRDLVLDLGGKGAGLLLLASNSLLQLSLDAVKVRHGLLGHLEVTVDLPLGLLDVTLDLLLALEGILSLIEGLLKLALDTGQVVGLVLSSLDVLFSLLLGVGSGTLLLAQLDDHLTLVGDLVLEGPDLVVAVRSVLLSGPQGPIKGPDLSLQLTHGRVDLGKLLLKAGLDVLLALHPLLGVVKLLLDVAGLVLDPDSLVNDVLHSRASRLEGQSDVVLLVGKVVVNGLHLLPGCDGGVDVGLRLGDLVLELLLVLGELGALEVWLDAHPELHPLPVLGHLEGPESPLAGVESQLLVLQLLELHPGRLASGTSLEPGKDGANLVLTLLLHPATNAGPEEDQSVAKPVLLLVQLHDVHDSLGGGLVVLGLGHGSSSDDVVPSLELGIGKLVGEASTADGNAGKDTVALVLVHHKAGLHTSRLLVGVGHHATDEVGLSLVEGGHQVV